LKRDTHMSAIGFCINPAPASVDSQMLDSFLSVVTPHISDNMSRLSGVVGLHRLNKTGKLAGSAFTVKTRPGDNLMVHKALDLARPGDVLVVDGGGDLNNALVGEIMMSYAVKRGLRGFVIDGAVRDSAAFAASSFPCYARGVVHRGPYKDGPGEINVPVSIGGLVISPGDIVVGDDDGVVAFPRDQAAQILELVHAQSDREKRTMDAIQAGTWDRKWINETLRAKGVLAGG
jgi:RraA family protein